MIMKEQYCRSFIIRIFILLRFSNVVLARNRHWQSGLQLNATTFDGVSPQCSKDTHTWINSLEVFAEISTECITQSNCTAKETVALKENLYAVKQLDAFGKFPVSGLFEIPLLFDGSYQECERISGEKYETNYCYLSLLSGKNSSCTPNFDVFPIGGKIFRTAVCMPYSCDGNDFPNVFNQLSSLPFTACMAACSRNHVKKDSAFWGFTSFMIVIITFALLATVFDYVRETVFERPSSNEKNIALRMLLAFSLKRFAPR